jgi:hypothetical protein
MLLQDVNKYVQNPVCMYIYIYIYIYPQYEKRNRVNNRKEFNYIIVDYRYKWTQNLLRINETRFHKLLHEFTPTGKRKTG